MSKILVCGDRKWTNQAIIKQWLIDVGATEVVEGDARGADRLAGLSAIELGMTVENGKLHVYHANWDEHHMAAGPIRNRLQLDTEEPDLVLAFHSNLFESTGTRDMVNYAMSKGYEVMVITGRQ